MAELDATLAALQLGDSFFPSGANAFSWGLETLRNEAMLDRAGLEDFVAGQLEHRWADFDRPALVAAWEAGDDLERVFAIDRLVDAGTLAREAREGARRIGGALLKVHQGLGTPGAARYRAAAAEGRAPGGMAVVQGWLGRACGLGREATVALSAHQLVTGLVSAALRMGLAGHVDAQRILLSRRVQVAALAARPVPPLEELCSSAPMAEIAVMRHETGAGRLFAS
jgi:urease accessory protein